MLLRKINGSAGTKEPAALAREAIICPCGHWLRSLRFWRDYHFSQQCCVRVVL